jgi:hypothetical protein
MRRFEELYVMIWCVVMPITGTVLLPSVQGTTPSYMMAFGSLILVFMKVRSGEIPPTVLRYLKTFLSLFLLWLMLLVASQLGLMASSRHDFGNVNLVDMQDDTVVFRRTIFTQSLYFFACVLIALYFRYFFKPRWRRYVHWGGFFLAAYGIYEWTYFLIFHETGDFLVNRSFGDHTASWSQPISFGSIVLLRIKSTLGEPTFFAAAVLPYLFLALDDRKAFLSGMLLFAAIFSTSTALLLTLPCVLLVKSFWTLKIRWDYLLILAGLGILLAAVAIAFPETFRNMFIDKINGDNNSGATRIDSGLGLKELYESFTIPNWLFGIGFGNAYLGIFDGLVVNTGLIGLGVFLWTFVRPTWSLPTTPGYEGLKAGLLSILILGRLSLSELFLPTTWMFVGLAWYYLAEYQRTRPVTTAISWPAAPEAVSAEQKESGLAAARPDGTTRT